VTHKKRMMFLDVRTIKTIVLSYLSTYKWKTNDLVVNWKIKFFLLIVKVVVG